MPEVVPAVRWLRFPWEEPDLDGPAAEGLDNSRMEFLYEVGTDGGVTRSIELMGVDLVPVGAASWDEICEAQEFRYQPTTAALARYKDQFGGILEGNVSDWEDAPHEEISEEEFERWWLRARAHLDQRHRSEHFA